jgi:aspartate/glutamate racemase
VNCKVFSFKKLTIADDIFFGNLLQDTYNEVHEDEDDDAELSNIIYDGLTTTNINVLKDDVATESLEARRRGYILGWMEW